MERLKGYLDGLPPETRRRIVLHTMVYRETHDVRFLDFARKVSDVYLSRIPEDMIPYWDFNAPELSSPPTAFTRS